MSTCSLNCTSALPKQTKQQLQPEHKFMIVIPHIKQKYMSELIFQKSMTSYITIFTKCSFLVCLRLRNRVQQMYFAFTSMAKEKEQQSVISQSIALLNGSFQKTINNDVKHSLCLSGPKKRTFFPFYCSGRQKVDLLPISNLSPNLFFFFS